MQAAIAGPLNDRAAMRHPKMHQEMSLLPDMWSPPIPMWFASLIVADRNVKQTAKRETRP